MKILSAPLLRRVTVPLLALMIGIMLGSTWTYTQAQLQYHSGSESLAKPLPSVTSVSPAVVGATQRPSFSAEMETITPSGSSEAAAGTAETLHFDDGADMNTRWDATAAAQQPLLKQKGAGTIPVEPLPTVQQPTTPRYATSGQEIYDDWWKSVGNVESTTKVRRRFRFHVYALPERYTTEALQLLEQRWPTSFCNRHKVKTNYTMLDWRHAFSLFTADVFIAKYLRFHPLHTDDPSEADVFIIPMMTHVYHCAGVNHYTVEIMSWLVRYHHYRLYLQHDHFLFWWRWGMHFNSVNRFWRRVTKYIPNVNLISFDYLEIMGRNAYQDFSLALKPRFLQTQHSIVMPYPDFSPELSNPIPLQEVNAPRKILFYFAGTSTIGGIRRWIKRNCASVGDPTLCFYEDFAKNVIDSARLGIPKGYPAAMRNSLFCGHAAGDALSSRRPTSAVLAGCIPVLICDLCLYAYENLLDYRTFAVFVSEADVMAGKLLERLRAIPADRVALMQRNLLKVRSHFVYNTTSAPQPGDALDTLVAQLSLRGSILRQYRRWFVWNHELSADAKDYPPEPAPKKRYLMKGNAAEEKDFNALG